MFSSTSKLIAELWKIFDEGNYIKAIEKAQKLRVERLDPQTPEFWSTLELEGFSAFLSKGSLLDLVTFRIKDCSLSNNLNLWYCGISKFLKGLETSSTATLESAYDFFAQYVGKLWLEESILSIDGVIFAFITKLELKRKYTKDIFKEYIQELAESTNVPINLLNHSIISLVLDIQIKFFLGELGLVRLENIIKDGLPRKYVVNLMTHTEIGDQ